VKLNIKCSFVTEM